MYIFFYNFVSSGWTNISLEGHWHFLLTIHFTSHLILRGFWNVNGYFSSGWSCIYPKGHCFDEGRQRKSLKRQQVITYCVVASVQVPMIAWLIKNRNNPSSFSLMDSEVILAIWKRLVGQSVSHWLSNTSLRYGTGCIVTLVAFVWLKSPTWWDA